MCFEEFHKSRPLLLCLEFPPKRLQGLQRICILTSHQHCSFCLQKKGLGHVPENSIRHIPRLGVEVSRIDGQVSPRRSQLDPLSCLEGLTIEAMFNRAV